MDAVLEQARVLDEAAAQNARNQAHILTLDRAAAPGPPAAAQAIPGWGRPTRWEIPGRTLRALRSIMNCRKPHGGE